MKKKKHTVYDLNEEQVVFLRELKSYKEYKKVLPSYKGMVTSSIKRKKIINSKHLNGVKEAIKTVNIEFLELFNLPILNTKQKTKSNRKRKPKFTTIKAFKEVFLKDELLTPIQNHEKYLKSGIWRRKRITLLKKRGSKCESCGYKPKNKSELHIHHRTYRKWGAEQQNHLKILCENCHNKLHNNYTITELENLFSKGIDPKV